MKFELEQILVKVQKPARYAGGEYGQIIKDKDSVDIRVALCFPDTYEIGMSNLGFRIIYGILNEIEDVWCERAFAPWIDMEEQMRANNVPLYCLESGDSLKDFDIIAFSAGYELSYTNILNILDLAGLPVLASDRSETFPLIIAGGVSVYNPEPLSDFIDLFVIGEGEEVICDLIGVVRQTKKNKAAKNEFILASAGITGIYAPALYKVDYNNDGMVSDIIKESCAAMPVKKRIVENLDDSYFPVKGIVPSTSLIHDRVVLELFRGCIRGCRFCQAGFVCRPVRSRSVETLINQAKESLKHSGYDELALLSLSTSDYKQLNELCDSLICWCEPRKIGLSLPSLRIDNFSTELLERIQKVRKSGLTFAPEAGSQRLRNVINKNVTEDDLFNTCRMAFESGWNSIKLYFMLGLPTETDEDVLAIAELANKILREWKSYAKNKSRGVRITVSTSYFVPKPHTPFQWESQISTEEYLRRVDLIRSNLKSKSITYNWHSPEQVVIEAALSRGDRRLGKVIKSAWLDGARLDSWSECFSFSKWLKAFEENGLSPEFYTSRERSLSEVLPWSVISSGVCDNHLWSEKEAAYQTIITPNCCEQCSDCGVSKNISGAPCNGK